jgi:phage terminase large subunit-like protein
MDGCSFRSIGAGQSPRGTRNEEKRPDFILIDDIDTDEECRNPTRITQKWNWIEQALFPTMSISGTKRFVVIGNIIAKHSVVTLAAEKADSFEKINILDAHNQPSWAARYTLDDVNYMRSKISYFSFEKEYCNNPLSEGAVFKDIRYGKIPPLHKFRLLVCYTDPSFKESKTNDYKGTVLMGEMEGTFYIVKAYLEQTSTAKMIEWHYDIKNICEGHTVVYYYMEANFVQDIFIEEFRKEGVKRESQIPLAPDERKKPDKFSRIEANLEPLNRQGKLIFNEAERTNPHMKRLEEQFKAIEPSMKAHDDGPDAVEGAVWILNNKLKVLAPIKVGGIKKSLKRY